MDSLNQEDLYQLIHRKNWKGVLDVLYSHRHEISADTMLKQAASTFESEFFSKANEYELDDVPFADNLETLYILNEGKFYQLSDSSFSILIIEIVKRKSIEQAIEYAKRLPDEEICKTIIHEFEKIELRKNGIELSSKNMIMNWIEIYNRLFELINNPDDAATYFSGSRFINVVRETERYFPDYSQFIAQRNREGKSTTRKIFYYDILSGLNADSRQKIIVRMMEILKPFQNDKVQEIEILLGIRDPIEKSVEFLVTDITEEKVSQNPVVFISYSWDNDSHKQWILSLANRLRGDGVEVILDQYFLKAGSNLPHFVENSISKADRILMVFTPNYRLKAENRKGGVGYEYSIMNISLYNNQTGNEKIIPVLRSGNMNESIPEFMQQFIHIDICNDENFENSYLDLLREIYNEPAIQIPNIGTKPNF